MKKNEREILFHELNHMFRGKHNEDKRTVFASVINPNSIIMDDVAVSQIGKCYIGATLNDLKTPCNYRGVAFTNDGETSQCFCNNFYSRETHCKDLIKLPDSAVPKFQVINLTRLDPRIKIQFHSTSGVLEQRQVYNITSDQEHYYSINSLSRNLNFIYF